MQDDHYQTWLAKQQAMGRTVAPTTAPYYPPTQALIDARDPRVVRNLGAGDPCLTHNAVHCSECQQYFPVDMAQHGVHNGS